MNCRDQWIAERALVGAAEHLLQMAARLKRHGIESISPKAMRAALACASALEKLHKTPEGLNRSILDFLIINAGETLKLVYSRFQSGEIRYDDLRKQLIAWMAITVPYAIGDAEQHIEILDRALAFLSAEDLHRVLKHADAIDEKKREGLQEAVDHIVGRLFGRSGSYVGKLRSRGLEYNAGIDPSDEWKTSALSWILGEDVKPAQKFISDREGEITNKQIAADIKSYLARQLPVFITKKIQDSIALDKENLPEREAP